MERVDYERMVVKELVDSYDAKELDIAPWYQRRSVWTRPQKAYLINSLFERKPIPSIYVRYYLDIETEKSIKEIVDGQQRVRSILEYVQGEFRAKHPEHRTRVTFEQLSRGPQGQRQKFLMTSLSIGYLIGADDSDVIEIFGRLNSVAKTLNRQEKRCARYSGEVKQFSLRIASRHLALWRGLNIFTANDIARMVEVQFVSDLAINMINGLSDYSASALDRFYKDNDNDFPQANDIEARMENVLGKIAGIKPEAIKDTIFSRSPLFFSLFIVLDSIDCNMTNDTLEHYLHQVDESYNSDTPISERSEADAEFYLACSATTQRIRSRGIRDQYLRRVMQIS